MLARVLVGVFLLTSISLFFFIVASRNVAAQDGDALLNRFRQEGPHGWAQYLARSQRLQGTFKDEAVEVAPKKGTIAESDFEFKQRPGCGLLMRQWIKYNPRNDGVGELWAYNDRYAFALRRNKPDAPWALTRVDTDLSKGVTIAPGGSRPSAGAYLSIPINNGYVDGATLPELIVNPHFTATKATAVDRGGRTLVKIEFTVRQPTSKKPGYLTGGWFLLDPDFLWVQRESAIQVQWRGSSKVPEELEVATTFHYREDAAPFPILAKMIEQKKVRTAAGGTKQEAWTFAFDLVEADVPASAFTLTAFGFPEPPGSKPPIPWYFWAALAGMVLLSLSAVLRWRAQRRQPTQRAGT